MIDLPGRIRSTPALATGMALAGLSIFWSGMTAGFVSDSWLFLERAHGASLLDVASLYNPSVVPATVREASEWLFYRPSVELAFWIELRIFGMNPVGYHLVALGAHVATATLVGVLARQLTGSAWAAWGAGMVFVAVLQAHEPVFDAADVHNALGGPLLLGAVVALAAGRTWLPAILCAILLTVDESGVLVLPLGVLYAVILRPTSWRNVLPVAGVVVAYAVARTLFDDITAADTLSCAAMECIAQGMDASIGRLFLRPETNIVRYGAASLPLLAVTAALAMVAGRRLVRLRPALFGIGWTLGTCLFFVIVRYPYMTDRFLYVPFAGVALLAGVIMACAQDRWGEGWSGRTRVAAVAAVMGVWVWSGAGMLIERGARWTAAGDEAARIVGEVMREWPQPPSHGLFIVDGAPHSLAPEFSPGNTGPYVFHNGLAAALRLAYGREDLGAVKLGAGTPEAGRPHLRIDVAP
ncbi:MAG TPA: hypothetical protein VFQ81_04030 [Candidatus Limnocylindria bacterium]|nr:hypothetical protein [Candidatus Limnocylindria bacterium]